MVSDISSSEYGIRARQLIDLAERLRGLGYVQLLSYSFWYPWGTYVRAHDLVNIPQIVVIGGQSAGKRYARCLSSIDKRELTQVKLSGGSCQWGGWYLIQAVLKFTNDIY